VPSMLRMNFISLPVTNSADGGMISYPKLSKCNKTAGFRPHTPLRGATAALGVPASPSGNAAPWSGCPLAPPLIITSHFVLALKAISAGAVGGLKILLRFLGYVQYLSQLPALNANYVNLIIIIY